MPVDSKAVLVVLFVQGILCGLYITTLTCCLRWLMFADDGWKYRKRMSWPMLIVTVVVSIFSLTALGFVVKLEFRFLRGGMVNPDLISNEVLVRVRIPKMFG